MRRSAYDNADDDNDHHQSAQHHDHTPLAPSEELADQNQQQQPPASHSTKTWTDQLGIYLKVMAKSKKSAPTPEVAAYYKHQREVLKRLIEVHELQDQENQEEQDSSAAASSSLVVPTTTTTTTTTQSSAFAVVQGAAAGALAGTPTNGKDESSSSPKNNNNNKNNSDTPIEPISSSSGDDGSAASPSSPGVVSNTAEELESEQEASGIAATCSLILNIVLLGIKIYAAVASGSLILLASLLDSILDLLSGIIMVYVEHKVAAAQNDPEYPLGTHYFEAVGTIIFSSFMFVASTRLVEDGVTALIDINNLSVDVTVPTLAVMGSVVISKAIAYLLCRSSESTIVQALADDHRNDVLTNTVGLAGLFLTQHVSKYFDPAVSLLCCLYLLRTWGINILSQAHALSGKMADNTYLNELTSLARNCDPRVIAVDKVWACTAGNGYIVEIDLVLDQNTPLKISHDIGEKFQMFLEKHSKHLNVSRAYVHLDWETDHDARRHQ